MKTIWTREFTDRSYAEYICQGFDVTYASLDNGHILALVPSGGFIDHYDPEIGGYWKPWSERLKVKQYCRSEVSGAEAMVQVWADSYPQKALEERLAMRQAEQRDAASNYKKAQLALRNANEALKKAKADLDNYIQDHEDAKAETDLAWYNDAQLDW